MPNLDQPEEKEDKKEEGEQTYTSASPPTNKMKILQGRLGNGELIQFEDNISSNKDDGGLVTLGVTHKQMCDALLALQNDETYRKILSKEIGHAVKTDKIIVDDITIKVYKEKYNKEKIALANLLKEIKQNLQLSSEIRNFNTEKLIDWLSKNGYHANAKALERKNSEFCHSENQLDDCCQNLEIFQFYVKSVGNGLEIGIKSIILYTKFANITLCIWENTKNAYELELRDVYEADSFANTIHLFRFDNSIDFKLLTVADSKNVIELSQQGNEENQSSFQLGSINDDVDDIDNDKHNYNNSVNSQPSQISRIYSWVSRKWNRHKIPTELFLKFCQNSLGWKNFVTSFTGGAGWVLDLWPPVLLGLLAHDYIVYGDQSENRYGATWDNILLGNAPNELSWASQFGSYFPTEFNYWLLPFLIPTSMLVAGIFRAVWNCSRSRPLDSDDFNGLGRDVTSLRNYEKIDFFNDTYRWIPLRYHFNLLSRLEFLLLHDTRLSDDQRATIFGDIQVLAKDYHSLARLNAMSSLANIAGSSKKENNDALETLRTRARQGNYYAKYLLWTLGKTQNTKQNTSKKNTAQDIGLHALFWVTSLCFSLRLSASLGFKFKDWIKYKQNQTACETNSNGANSNYTWALVPEIADYQCIIPGCNSPDFYYPYRSNTQDCLNAFLSKLHSASDIKTFVESLPGTFDSVSFKNQSWYTWSPKDLKSVLDTIAKRFPVLKRFDFSIDQYKEMIIDDGIIDVLTNFFQEMGILQIDIHNLGMGANPVNKILQSINGTITEWIDLSHTDSDDSVAETLKNIMAHTLLKVIKAVRNYFTDSGIGYIAQGSENSTLTDLDVSFNPFGALGWKFISNSLPKMQLGRLTANDVELSQADFKEFGKSVAQTPTLEKISLQRTNIGDQQIDEFTLETNPSNLRALDVSETAITGNGVSNAIRNFKNSTLEDINLGGLPIQGKDLNNISEKLRDTNIKSLGIPNIAVTPSKFCQFTVSLNQTSVSTLNVEKNALGDQGADCIKDAIEAPNSKLENINYSDNQASKNGGQKIMQAVAESDKVKIINLSKNPFAGLDRASVENILQQNQQLEAVILDDTNIGPEVGDGIAKGLLKAKQLKQLSINDNPNLGNTANKNITQSLIKPIANMDKLGGKLSNDQLRDLHHAESQTQVKLLDIDNTGLQDDGALGYCQIWPTTHNALDQLQAKNNLVDPNKVNMENCQISSASKLSFDNLGKHLTTGYIVYNLIDYFFTDNRTWTLDDDDQKQINQYKTEMEYLWNQHKPQITSVAAKNPHLNYLFEKVANLSNAVAVMLASIEKTKELSDTILKDVRERLADIEKSIHEISRYNKEMKTKHEKERRFEERCKRNAETGVIITQRNALTGKVTQKFLIATDSETIKFLKAKKQTLAAETKTKSMRFTEMQQFWQLQHEAEKLHTDLKRLEVEKTEILQLGK